MGTTRVTIAEIAAEAGVSIPTVSKVLNGRPDVAATTRSRVSTALDRHGYRRRGTAPPVAGRLIDLVMPATNSPWAEEILTGVRTTAGAAGVCVVLSRLGEDGGSNPGWGEAALAHRSLGAVLVHAVVSATDWALLAEQDLPVVLVDTAGEAEPGIPTVGSNNWNGGRAATRHLISLGHTRIAVLSGAADVTCARARVDGFRSAHEEAGLPVDPTLIHWGSFQLDAGRSAALEVLRRPDRPTAIFAGSDQQAVGVLRAAYELGLSVPGDLSVVGYDDLPQSSWLIPALTTVHQPLRRMAAAATAMVLAQARGEEPAVRNLDLHTELVVRESTGPVPTEIRRAGA